jgi:Xaa-Pro aminopeptidase
MTAPIPMSEADRRHRRLRSAMAEAGLDGLLAFAPGWRRENVRYLTGAPIAGELAFAYLPADGDPTAFFVHESDEREARGAGLVADIRRISVGDLGPLEDRIAGDRGERLGIAHAELVPVGVRRALARAVSGAELVSATALMDAVRLVKTPWELEQLRAAAALCDDAWSAFLGALRVGIAEHEIVAAVEAALKGRGAEDNFMIIASGGEEVRGMTPPTQRRVRAGDLVRTELTPQLNGYWAQICRTAVIGPPSAGQRASFELFEEATAAGLAAVRAGVTAHDVAVAENDVFRRHGYGEYCTSQHTRVRGHGHGLHFDEVPIMEGVETVLEADAVVIVHPNTYTPLAGYHVHGDPVVVTANGYEPLLGTPRVLHEVAV